MKTASITLNFNKSFGNIHPFVYGHFFEHTYDTMQGLLAERLRNRKFGLGFADQSGVPAYWKKCPLDSSARFRVQPSAPIQSNGRWEEYLRQFNLFRDVPSLIDGKLYSQEILSSHSKGHNGICQRGIYVKKKQAHEVSVWLRAGDASSVSIGFTDNDNRWIVRERFAFKTGEWEHHRILLDGPDKEGFYTFAILCEGNGEIAVFAPSLRYADHERGIRKDVLDALADMRPSVIRYPGGCFADAHHWEVMIGPQDGRMPYFDLMWRQWEENDFGTDEFLYLCERVGAQPLLCVNFAGSVEESRRWIEYCNGSSELKMGQLRACNGHPAPYGVKYWEIGNEQSLQGEIGHGTPEEYVAKSSSFIEAMKQVDSDITIICNGENLTGDETWTRKIVPALGNKLDAISVHHYASHRDEHSPQDDAEVTENVPLLFRACVNAAGAYEKLLRKMIRLLDGLSPNRLIPICLGEWNMWVTTEWHDQGYRIGHALFCASLFHVFHRLCNHVWMANQSTTINVQGLITSTPRGIILHSEYRAFELYAKHFGSTALDISASCDELFEGTTALDVSASTSNDKKRLYIAVVNRHPEKDIPARIDLGAVSATAELIAIHELNAPTLGARNTEEDNEKIIIRHRDLSQAKQPDTHVFPAHSVSILEWKI